MTNIEIILLCIVVLLAVAVGFLVATLIDFIRTASAAVQFLNANREPMASALGEIEETAKSARGIAENVNAVTGDVSHLSSSLSDAAGHIRGALDNLHAVTSRGSSRYEALKAGLRVALEVFLSGLSKREGGKE
jgi:methyl-accepting chemotaxis protein